MGSSVEHPVWSLARIQCAIATAEVSENESAQRSTLAEAIVTYDSVSQIGEVLTAERLELPENLLASSAESTSQLAGRISRGTAAVLVDLTYW
jgi:predicted transcriptional regulator